MVDLTALFALTPATVSEALAALERKGLLQREKDEKDKRRWRLKPTEEGQALARALKGYAAPMSQALREVEDPEGFLLGLMALLAALARQEVVAETGLCLTCRHLRREEGFFCALLQIPLAPLNLRLACPDPGLGAALGHVLGLHGLSPDLPDLLGRDRLRVLVAERGEDVIEKSGHFCIGELAKARHHAVIGGATYL